MDCRLRSPGVGLTSGLLDHSGPCKICYGYASTMYSVKVLAAMYREDQTACTVYMEAMTTLLLNEKVGAMEYKC